MCSVCGSETEGSVKEVKIVETLSGASKVVNSSIYGLRRCKNNECRITWDRDHNARRSIYYVLESEIKDHIRPDYLKFKSTVLISPSLKSPVQETSASLLLTVKT